MNKKSSKVMKFLPRGKSGTIHVRRFRTISAAQHHKYFSPRVSVQNLPEQFNWANFSDVVQKRYGGIQPPNMSIFILPPVNQGDCGNCYAVASANMTSNRFGIWQLKPPIRLSSDQLTDCSSIAGADAVSQGCGGGNPFDCANYMNQHGIMTKEEYKSRMSKYTDGHAYSVCDGCMAPKPVPDICTGQGPYKVHKPIQQDPSITQPDVAVQLEDINNIKSEIFNNGPLVTMYKVWDDFNFPTIDGMHCWPETNNIYIRGSYQGRAKISLEAFLKNQDVDPGEYANYFKEQSGVAWADYWASAHIKMGGSPKSDIDPSVVGHAVLIVGWGVDYHVPNFGKLEYWIVQNSWGSAWNDNGYFKVAFSRQKVGNPPTYQTVVNPLFSAEGRHLNSEVGIDITTHDNYGGVFTWIPTIVQNGQLLTQPSLPSGRDSPSSPPSPPPLPTPSPPSLPLPPPSVPGWEFPDLPFHGNGNGNHLPLTPSTPPVPPPTPSAPPVPPVPSPAPYDPNIHKIPLDPIPPEDEPSSITGWPLEWKIILGISIALLVIAFIIIIFHYSYKDEISLQ
jgi:hypothetical protein